MRILILLLAALALAACKQNPELPAMISPYKIDIQQGNVVTQDMLSRLKPGMTKSQVRFVLGTPLVSDAFHPNRWDYVYRYQKAGKLMEQSHVTAVFENDLLLRIEGDVAPADSAMPAAEAVSVETQPLLKRE